MPYDSDLKQRLAEIADALSMSTAALLAMADENEPVQASREADVLELSANFRAIADPHARELLLRLSRHLAEDGRVR